ncbi:MAG: excinuclease ABC subunit UvrA, partial [bacterium]
EVAKEYTRSKVCPVCHGSRLKPEVLAVKVGGLSIAQVTRMSLSQLKEFFERLELSERELFIASEVLKEIKARLNFLVSVGLEYLSLDRAAGTLSGGEAQRIRLATQIGSGLVGVLYILDEPSIGLHQRDNERLIATLKRLRDLGNTLIVVEHDEDTIREADYLVDIGPGAGVHGGEIVAAGTVEEVMRNESSETGQYLCGKKRISVPPVSRQSDGRYLEIIGARENNLKNINVKIPLGLLVCVTGVSGSGKSTLINEILYKQLAKSLSRMETEPGAHDEIKGIEQLDKIINIDQSPIGRTPRSNPATYTGVFTDIRELFASTPEAKMRGYKVGRFSFNVKGGRCEACEGDGILRIEMHFLPDVEVLCEVCKGKRYNRETLEVRYKGKNIADVLEMTVEEANSFFDSIPKIKRKLQVLCDVGLGYIRLGQSATTFSGGEAQRIKLATELAKRSTGRTIYILDEPTTGLHFADIQKLLDVLNRLVDSGNTVVVIEHNLEVIKTADYLIDLGPEGGDGGGTLVAAGTRQEIAANPFSYTGRFLRKILDKESE